MTILHFLLLFASIVFVFATKYEVLDYNPQANPAAMIVVGLARFTVLTPNMIRLEYAQSFNAFENRSTLAIVNRYFAQPPPFQLTNNGGVLTITTSALAVQYQIGQPFNATTLSIRSRGIQPAFTWQFGTPQSPRNLLGTIKSLDELGVVSLNCTNNANIKVHDEHLHCEWALISKDGWATIDDSQNRFIEFDF